MKPASRHLIATWILEAWAQLDKELVIRSFKPSVLTMKSNGSEDNINHCFNSGQTYLGGASLLKDQVNISHNDIVNYNLFEVTDSDVKPTSSMKVTTRMIL